MQSKRRVCHRVSRRPVSARPVASLRNINKDLSSSWITLVIINSYGIVISILSSLTLKLVKILIFSFLRWSWSVVQIYLLIIKLFCFIYNCFLINRIRISKPRWFNHLIEYSTLLYTMVSRIERTIDEQ